MTEITQRSVDALKQILELVRADLRLLRFGVLSVVLVGFYVLVWAFLIHWIAPPAGVLSWSMRLMMIYGAYLIGNVVAGALVDATRRKLDEAEVDLVASLAVASSRLTQLAKWAVLQSLVVMVLGGASSADAWLLDPSITSFAALQKFTWWGATFFVLPIIIDTGADPLEALQKSAEILPKVWGEALVGSAILYAAYSVLLGLGIALARWLVGPFDAVVQSPAIALLLLLYFAAIAAVFQVFETMYRSFIYYGVVAGTFPPQHEPTNDSTP